MVAIDTGRKQPYALEITTQEVTLRGLPEALHGATFVHLSDFHGGYGNTEPVFEEAIRRVNALQPDFALLTGDYVDDHARPRDYSLESALRRLQARRGVFGSFGNHDHRRGFAGSRRMLEAAGVQVLHNANVCVAPGLWIAGIDDLYEGEPDLDRTLGGVPDDVTCILLSHNPRLIERVPDRDCLILSGHTHGGQFNLSFFPPALVVRLHLRCRQVAGWYANGRARLYVNRGLGVTGKPFRIHCPAEIAIFRMIPDPSSRTEKHITRKTFSPLRFGEGRGRQRIDAGFGGER